MLILAASPNMITLIGLLFIVSAFILNLYYLVNAGVTEDLPPLLYWYTAGCMFAYQSLDAIDGKQARRTGSVSPLGQLFDHGCDVLNLVMQSYILPILFRVQSTALSMAIAFACTPRPRVGSNTTHPTCIALFAFFMASWEEYNTHVLYLGYFSGPVDGQILAILIFIVAPFFGSRRFMAAEPLSWLGVKIPFGDLAAAIIVVGAAGAVIGSLLNVYRSKRGPWPLAQLAQFTLLTSIAVATFAISTDLHRSLLDRSLFTAIFGLASAYSIFQIICAHLCRMSFPIWSPTHWTILVVAMWVIFLEYCKRGPELRDTIPLTLPLSACLLYDLVVYGRLVCKTIGQFCAFLKIRCFRLKRKPD